ERERELPAHLVRPADGVAERSRDDARRLLERVADARGRERPARAHAQLQALNRAEVTRRELPGLRRPAPKRQKKWPALRRTPTSGEVAGALAPSASERLGVRRSGQETAGPCSAWRRPVARRAGRAIPVSATSPRGAVRTTSR